MEAGDITELFKTGGKCVAGFTIGHLTGEQIITALTVAYLVGQCIVLAPKVWTTIKKLFKRTSNVESNTGGSE
jgi:hypothetical protein